MLSQSEYLATPFAAAGKWFLRRLGQLMLPETRRISKRLATAFPVAPGWLFPGINQLVPGQCFLRCKFLEGQRLGSIGSTGGIARGDGLPDLDSQASVRSSMAAAVLFAFATRLSTWRAQCMGRHARMGGSTAHWPRLRGFSLKSRR